MDGPSPVACEYRRGADALFKAKVPDWNELTTAQRDELKELAISQSVKKRPPTVALKRDGKCRHAIDIDGCVELGLLKLRGTFAANSPEPAAARLAELLKYLSSVNAAEDDGYNAALSFIDSMEPQNQAEALLLVQMYCTHDAAIRSLSMLGDSKWMNQVQSFGNLAVKLLRTSQGQMETLARMRRGGEQVVRHIHVDNRGGQAVITETVQAGGKKNAKSDGRVHATGAAGICPSLLGSNPVGE
jgi:hypothetical protein